MITFCKVFHIFAMHVDYPFSAAVTRAVWPYTGSVAVTWACSAAVTRAVWPSHGQCGRHTGSVAVTRAVRPSPGQIIT